MKKLLAMLLTAVLLLTCVCFAEESGRKSVFPDNTFVEMDPSYITGVTQRGKTVPLRGCDPGGYALHQERTGLPALRL